jgi:hypothetical protein
MAELPELSESTKRKLALQWSTLLEKYGLTGEHVHWRERERVKLRQWPGTRRGRNPDGSWRVDERLVDKAGIAQSVAIAQGRLYDLAVAYWWLWSSSAGYEIFAGWLQILNGQVLAEIALIWKGKSDAIDRWYDRACAPAVEMALLPKVKEFEGWARNAELKALQQATTAELLQRLERAAEGKSDTGAERKRIEPISKALLEEPSDASPEESNGETQPATLPWHMRLRAARRNAKLSRPGAARSLKTKGVQITADAIKKHEEGAAMPKPDVRKEYSVIYEVSEGALFL